ncbi:hypothetical protein V2S85_26475 [Novosphingobium resinovorum]|nr:hypothetical protein [Novosphingobium resinovorum]
MNNVQTLINILRARDGMPTQFSSVSQFRGNINLTASASVNGQLRGEGLTSVIGATGSDTTVTTNSTTTALSALGAQPSTSIVNSVVTTPVRGTSSSSTIAEGVDLYTPQISGQIVSGTAFDVAVFDTQKFYQGITTALPCPTVETLLRLGMDNRVIEFLSIVQVEFRLKEAAGGRPAGMRILRYVNNPADAEASKKFATFVECYGLDAGMIESSASNIVAVSRLTRGTDGKTIPLAIDKVTVIDGEKFGLSNKTGIGDDPTGDASLFLTKVSPEKRVPRIFLRPDLKECTVPARGYTLEKDFLLSSGAKIDFPRPAAASADAIYIGNGLALLSIQGNLTEVPVTMDISFRSPEGLYRYIGAYLQFDGGKNVKLDGEPLFEIAEGAPKDALAQASYRGKRYGLVNTPKTGIRNAQIFTLLQQLINLHKEAADRPTAIPVRAIP